MEEKPDAPVQEKTVAFLLELVHRLFLVFQPESSGLRLQYWIFLTLHNYAEGFDLAILHNYMNQSPKEVSFYIRIYGLVPFPWSTKKVFSEEG